MEIIDIFRVNRNLCPARKLLERNYHCGRAAAPGPATYQRRILTIMSHKRNMDLFINLLPQKATAADGALRSMEIPRSGY
jgi:hypothetical protein